MYTKHIRKMSTYQGGLMIDTALGFQNYFLTFYFISTTVIAVIVSFIGVFIINK